MELDEDADNMLAVEPVEGDEDHEAANKRAKTAHYTDEQYQRAHELYRHSIQTQVLRELIDFKQRALENNKAVLRQIEQRIQQQESQMREKFYFVPHVYAEQIRALQSSTAFDLTAQHIRSTSLPAHPATPKTTAHVTIRHNVAPRGFEERTRPRQYAPYFEDGEGESDPATIATFYHAPAPHFRDLRTELGVFRLLLALEDTRRMEHEDEETARELISPVNLALASRVCNVPEAIIKHYFAAHTGLLAWKTQRAGNNAPLIGSAEDFYDRFCRQCNLFECPLHSHNGKWVPVQTMRRTADLRDVPRSTPPCSDTCHLKVPLREFTAEMPRDKVTLLKRGVVVLAKHYCRIRKCIAPSFTCAQIRDYVAAHLSTVHSLPKLAAPDRQFKLQRNPANEKEFASYEPCSHEGKCVSPQCYCHAHHLQCEKYCACAADCTRRFKGCGCTGPCSNKCRCKIKGRECDLDLCTCDPHTCGNRDMQTKKPKHLWIGASAVAGFGVFAVDRINKGEFVGEYVGEVIPSNEAERRGLIADKIKRSYLFDTGNDLCVDSTKFGNRLKFANHSATPNCKPKMMRVTGTLRLAFYAVEDVEPNEELFIDYDYPDPSSKGITNERPADVRANKGHVSLAAVLQVPRTGHRSVHDSDCEGDATSEETSDDAPSM